MVNIRENVERVNQRIQSAALKAGRNPNEVRLVGVTKTVGVMAIRQAMACGVKIFGENRIQEALPKIQELGSDPIRWHFVGHLQTNKVKQAVGLFDLIHSVDSLKLAVALDAGMKIRKGETGTRQKILIQVNVSGEATKSGVSPEKLDFLVKEIAQLKTLSINGLMTIPPLFTDPEQSRPVFRTLRELAGSLEREGIEVVSMKELSMGMSDDFEVAIEEGATLVRIGTAIFGPRS